MLNQKKINTIVAIKNEFDYINSHPNPNIDITVEMPDDNFFHWTATMIGPKDTSYRSGFFILDIDFPEDYPEHPPKICFRTPIYHINVNSNKLYGNGIEMLGQTCISAFNSWDSKYTMMEVLSNIFGLFYIAKPECSYDKDRANEFIKNRDLYEKKISYFTNKYANSKNANIKYDKSWDFSYD